MNDGSLHIKVHSQRLKEGETDKEKTYRWVILCCEGKPFRYRFPMKANPVKLRLLTNIPSISKGNPVI